MYGLPLKGELRCAQLGGRRISTCCEPRRVQQEVAEVGLCHCAWTRAPELHSRSPWQAT